MEYELEYDFVLCLQKRNSVRNVLSPFTNFLLVQRLTVPIISSFGSGFWVRPAMADDRKERGEEHLGIYFLAGHIHQPKSKASPKQPFPRNSLLSSLPLSLPPSLSLQFHKLFFPETFPVKGWSEPPIITNIVLHCSSGLTTSFPHAWINPFLSPPWTQCHYSHFPICFITGLWPMVSLFLIYI